MGEDEESLEGFLNGPRQDLCDMTTLERNSVCLNKETQERMYMPCPAPVRSATITQTQVFGTASPKKPIRKQMLRP